jgi:hypothetical protein
MKKAGISFLLLFFLFACNNSNTPDVSGIKVNLQVVRFEDDFFSIDTNHVYESLGALHQKYPVFLQDYLQNILGLPPFTDTSTQVFDAIRQFLRDYRPLKDSVDKTFPGNASWEPELMRSLQYLHYYFPNYKAPEKIFTFIGPMDAYFQASLGAYGDVLSRAGLAVGLQLHLGKDFSMYHSEMGQSLYPDYISRRFTPDYIAVNCVKNLLDDIHPDDPKAKSLLGQMVEKGKKLYVLDKLMPATPDSLKIGYTGKQLEGCYANEGRIWNFFLTNNLLLNSEPGMLKGYISDAPNTPEFGEGSPGFIGLFCGRQIVRKFMEEHAALSLDSLLKIDPQQLYQLSKYRPK